MPVALMAMSTGQRLMGLATTYQFIGYEQKAPLVPLLGVNITTVCY